MRGSIACPTPDHVEYGGNTSCLEVYVGERRLVLDAGTGLRALGQDFMKQGLTRTTLLLSHTHWDHINGFPFFAPGYSANFKLRVMAGHLREHPGGVRDVLAGQMAQPNFPVPLDALRADLRCEDFDAGDSFELGDGLSVRTCRLNHPNGATGYRLEYAGKSFCYITDTEHTPGAPDQNILALIEGADLVVYDSTYTDAEYPAHVGWGHSTWQEGIRLCQAAHARQLAIFHHDPDHDDATMRRIEAEAKAEWSGALVAREGMVLTLA